AVLRRAPSRPTFGNVYRVPSNRLGERTRYAQQVTSFDTLKKEDLCFVRVGRSVEEMREVERRGLEILAAHNPEIVTQRRWERSADDLLSLDTTVRVKKGSLVVEYTFSSTDGVWLCREVERDGKNFLDFRDPVRSSNAGRFHSIDVRYSPSDDARRGFNGIGEALSKLEGGMTGRSALQVVGEPSPADNDPLASAAFVNTRNPRSASIPDIEKRSVEDSRDVLRAMDNDPAVRGVLTQAGTINSSITLIQRLFDAGKNGTRRQGLVDLMRREAGTVLGVLNDPTLKTNLLRSRVRLEELKRANTGVDKSAIDREIDQRIKALDDMEAMLSKPQLRDFCEHIRDKSEYNVSTFWNWLEENIAVIVAIVVACLAVVLAVFTFGITSPLAVAAISASAGVIASELTSEARFQLHQEFDEEVTSGRATFRNRSRTGAFTRAVIKDEMIYNPETGKMEHADLLTHLVDPLGKDFVTGFVTTLAFMGAGAAIGRGLTVLANTQCVQGLIANSPRLTRIIAYFAKAEQGAPLAQKNMKNFLSNWGRETAEEFRDEVAERIAGDWASAVFIAKKNFKPKNPSDPKTLARSDASVRNMGEFEYETNGNPAQAIAEITASMTAEGGKVTVAADGKITVEIDGRVFLLSPDVAVAPSGPESSPAPGPAPGAPAALETAPEARAQAVKLADAARADPRNIAALKNFLKANDVDDATRLEIAQTLLGRPLADAERKAIIASHNAPGSIDNLTAAEIFGKARPLLEVMSRTDAQLLLDAAVCGKAEPFDARRIRPGQSCSVQTSSGRLLTATFLRVQGGKYIFSYGIGSGSIEVTIELQNIIGYAETVPRAPAGVSDQVLLTHVQSGAPISIDVDGANRECVYVRMSTTDSNIIIVRDRRTGTEHRVTKAKVFGILRGDGPGEVIPLTPAPAPAAVITDAEVEKELGFGIKIKINGREYDVIGQNSNGDYMLEDIKLGTVAPFPRAVVLQAGRVAIQFERANTPAAITDADATARVLAGLQVELDGERFTYSRPSAQPGCFAMKRANGTERRFTIAEVIAAAKVVMQAEVRPAPAPVPAPAPAVAPRSDAQLLTDLQADGARIPLNYGGTTDQHELVRVSTTDPNVLVMRNTRTNTIIALNKGLVFASMRGSRAEIPVTRPGETPLTKADLVQGEIYEVFRSSGAIQQWRYVGLDIDGNP
ncbi:MAG TPA: hypothetical protein PKV72_05110, partial [Candidatus Peribacteria bacterium]|nr:hypothetical protein [Candidatus Peribacteria bacterium]